MMKCQGAQLWCAATMFAVVVTVGCQRPVKVGSTDHDVDVAFLKAHMPASEVDRVGQAQLSHHADVMRRAWKGSPWQEDVDVTLWREAILPPTHVSERCEDWCDVLIERLQGVDTSGETVKQAVSTLNAAIGDTLDVHYHPTKRRAPDQGPLETMELGWSSCTGLSILLANACRTRGIPARLAGTPLWVDDSGNHTWVEVWADGHWHHVEAADPNSWDSAWFDAKAAEAADQTDPMHRIYAVMPSGPVVFPLAWAPERQDIHAVDVTDRYRLPTRDQCRTLLRTPSEKGTEQRLCRIALESASSTPPGQTGQSQKCKGARAGNR